LSALWSSMPLCKPSAWSMITALIVMLISPVKSWD